MKRFTLIATLLVVTAVAVAVVAADKEKQKPKETPKESVAVQKADEGDRWMQAKLHSAQQIFAALTQGELETVKKRAQLMAVMNVMEDWLKKKSEFSKKSAYQGQLNAFEFATKELIRHSDDENIDGALEAWVKLSRSCIECHKLIRDPAKQH